MIIDNTPSTPATKYVSILGRQPELSMAELEQVFGASAIRRITDESAVVESAIPFDVQRFGGVVRAGAIVADIRSTDWNEIGRQIVRHYTDSLSGFNGKITIGFSVYGSINSRAVQKTGLTLKQALKKQGVSMRLIPNDTAVLSTATSHHNKLGLSPNRRELIVVIGQTSTLLAESIGTQNITALARRDQGRPKRDAFVGMLPPKLALMMVNMSGASELTDTPPNYILDPFCGTGVVLQEAALLGFDVYGSDLSEKMVDYSTLNLEWLRGFNAIGMTKIEQGDATEHTWDITGQLAGVVGETYLGQPFSAPPASEKLAKVVGNCNDIITKFLRNLADQIDPETPLCLAVPAWRDSDGDITHLPLVDSIEKLGYSWQPARHYNARNLLYYREDQVVARQLLILQRI